jgi:glycosyltransferase involved in cell wall biosynthesis
VERVERYCITRVSHILTVVEESSDRLIKLGVPEDRLTVVGNTPPLTRATAVAPKAPAPVGAPVDVVYLGLLEVSRGINELIDAIAQLRHEPTQFRLRIIGNGRDESIFRARAASHGLSNSHVEFLGYQPYDVAMNIVASADIGALPLHMNEHMNTTVPNKLFDYMSVGLPVITSDTHAAARIVSSTGSGVIFRAKDAEDLAVQLRKLADPVVRSAMGKAGYHAILKDYHWELDAERLLDAIRRCGRTLGNGQLEPPP